MLKRQWCVLKFLHQFVTTMCLILAMCMKALSNCPPCRVQSSNRFLLRELANGVLGLQEPWLLHDFAEDFYGVELRLVVVGYIRPEVGVPIIAQRNRLVYQTPHPSCYWESLPRCIIHFPRWSWNLQLFNKVQFFAGKFCVSGSTGGENSWRWSNCKGSTWYDSILTVCRRPIFNHSVA